MCGGVGGWCAKEERAVKRGEINDKKQWILKFFTQVQVMKYKFYYFGIWDNSFFPTWILRNVSLITAIKTHFLMKWLIYLIQ